MHLCTPSVTTVHRDPEGVFRPLPPLCPCTGDNNDSAAVPLISSSSSSSRRHRCVLHIMFAVPGLKLSCAAPSEADKIRDGQPPCCGVTDVTRGPILLEEPQPDTKYEPTQGLLVLETNVFALKSPNLDKTAFFPGFPGLLLYLARSTDRSSGTVAVAPLLRGYFSSSPAPY